MKKVLLSLIMVTLLALTACTSPPGVGTTQKPFSDQVETIVATTLQAIPSNTPEPTAEPGCPEPGEGTRLLTREGMGYCLFYPEGYIEVGAVPTDVCLVPEGPTMGCHTMIMNINVQGAEGRTADQAADSLIAQRGFSGQHSNLIIAGENAVMLEPIHGQATARVVFIVHGDRLYTLNFIGPWDEKDNPELEQSELFYSQIISSFGFVPAPPWVPTPTPITQQLFVPSEVPGSKFIAKASGLYEFKILSGSYSVCASTAPYPACGKWASEILVYVNRDIAWTAQPNRWTLETDGINSFAPAHPDFLIGNSIYRDTAAEAEAGSKGSRITVSLQKGDYVWLLLADGQDAYTGNVGGMTLSISIIAPLP